MTTKIRKGAIQSFFFTALLLVGLASVATNPAHAQTFAPGEKIMVLNVAGAVGRMANFSVSDAVVFINPPNVTNQRLLWTFTPEQVLVFQDNRLQTRSVFKVASATDSMEVLSTQPNSYFDGALVVEQKDDPNIHNRRPANRWELIRVPNLPFFQLRNGWNEALCLMNQPQTGQLLHLATCNPGDSRQWYSLLNDKGLIK